MASWGVFFKNRENSHNPSTASLCDTTRTKPIYAYSQAALTDGVTVFCLGLVRLALNMYIEKEMK